jgi:hypothetical protein
VGWEGTADIALESPRVFEGYRFLPAGSDSMMIFCAMMSPASGSNFLNLFPSPNGKNEFGV